MSKKYRIILGLNIERAREMNLSVQKIIQLEQRLSEERVPPSRYEDAGLPVDMLSVNSPNGMKAFVREGQAKKAQVYSYLVLFGFYYLFVGVIVLLSKFGV